MKARLIANPISGADAAAVVVPSLNQRLRQRLGDLDIVLTVAPGDAERAARQAAALGYDRLYVAGGDGTLNEVINGAAAVEGALDRLIFGLLPLGTGNDLAQSLGLPPDPELALDLLLLDRVAALDLGSLNGRLFANASAGGFIAEVSDAVTPELKTLAGRLAYLIGGAQVLLDYEPLTLRLRAGTDPDLGPDADLEGEEVALAQMFAVCNGRTIGGGRPIAPGAVLDDGLLDACLVLSATGLELIGLLRRIARGEHVEDERVRYLRAPALDLRADQAGRPIKVNTDGEVLEALRCSYRVLPGAATFLVGEVPEGALLRPPRSAA